jgi:prevent-host-death family protein
MIAKVHEAKTQLSKLLDAAERGEEVVITRRGGGVTRFLLVPAPLPDRAAIFGALRDELPDDIDYAAADAEVLALFEQSLEKN